MPAAIVAPGLPAGIVQQDQRLHGVAAQHLTLRPEAPTYVLSASLLDVDRWAKDHPEFREIHPIAFSSDLYSLPKDAQVVLAGEFWKNPVYETELFQQVLARAQA